MHPFVKAIEPQLPKLFARLLVFSVIAGIVLYFASPLVAAVILLALPQLVVVYWIIRHLVKGLPVPTSHPSACRDSLLMSGLILLGVLVALLVIFKVPNSWLVLKSLTVALLLPQSGAIVIMAFMAARNRR